MFQSLSARLSFERVGAAPRLHHRDPRPRCGGLTTGSFLPQPRITAPYLMKPRNTSRTRLTSHPAEAKALGMVSAPVPTMRLNMYTSPT